jgi:hypothetical protein
MMMRTRRTRVLRAIGAWFLWAGIAWIFLQTFIGPGSKNHALSSDQIALLTMATGCLGAWLSWTGRLIGLFRERQG